jgi:hypothetical protein
VVEDLLIPISPVDHALDAVFQARDMKVDKQAHVFPLRRKYEALTPLPQYLTSSTKFFNNSQKNLASPQICRNLTLAN